MAYELRMSLHVRAPRDAVFERLLAAHHLARWWCNFAQIEPKPGGKFVFGGDYAIAQPPAPEPAWRCHFTGGVVRKSVTFAWPLFGAETNVTWDIEDVSDGSVLRATHAGLSTFRSTCGSLHDAWRMCLGNLKAIAEGRGDSFRPDHEPPREPRIKLDTVLDVPRQRAFGALVSPAEVHRWAAGGRHPTIDAREGGTFDLGWEAEPSRIVVFAPPDRLAVDWPHASGTTRVTFALEEKAGDRCALHFVHEGFPPEEDSPIVPLRCRWSDRLVALKNLVEAGETGFLEPYDAQASDEDSPPSA